MRLSDKLLMCESSVLPKLDFFIKNTLNDRSTYNGAQAV